MKKRMNIITCGLAMCLFAACGQTQSDSAFPVAVSQTEEAHQSPVQSDSTGQKDEEQEQEVDVDLTKLSSIMCYSEVYTMVTYPEQYWGKTVKMTGEMVYGMSSGEDPKYYFAVLIADALACCQQGIEFVLESGSNDPKDYPAIGSQVTVVGEFTSYEENGMTYCQLVSAKVLPQEDTQ